LTDQRKRDVFVAAVEYVDQDFHHALNEQPEAPPAERILEGAAIFFRFCQRPTFRRVVLIEAPIVLPGAWSMTEEFTMLRTELQTLADAEKLAVADIDMAAEALFGAISRAGYAITEAAEPAEAATEALIVVEALLAGMIKSDAA
jgi:hypothetical protein